MTARQYTLLDARGRPYTSAAPGTLGGHRRQRIYGRLDCPAALRALARGGYTAHRVFFAGETDAIAAGYRPCAVCLPGAYRTWKRQQAAERRPVMRLAPGAGPQPHSAADSDKKQ